MKIYNPYKCNRSKRVRKIGLDLDLEIDNFQKTFIEKVLYFLVLQNFFCVEKGLLYTFQIKHKKVKIFVEKKQKTKNKNKQHRINNTNKQKTDKIPKIYF